MNKVLNNIYPMINLIIILNYKLLELFDAYYIIQKMNVPGFSFIS